MRIDRLTLSNFRRFENVSLDFHPRFNLIMGENGSGKTAVLDALAVAAGSWLLGLQGGPKPRSIEREDVRVLRVEQGGVFHWESQYPTVVQAEGAVDGAAPLLSGQLAWSRRLDGPGGRTKRGGAKGLVDAARNRFAEARSGKPVALPLVSHYGAGRLWVPAKDMHGKLDEDDPPPSRFDGYNFSLDARIGFHELFRWMRTQKLIQLQEGKETPQYEATRRAILSCVDGARWVDYMVKERALIIEIGSSGQLPFDMISDGQRAMAALAADIALKACQLNPQFGADAPEMTEGVVLIDELDLHLHPRWQRRVVSDLKKAFPKIQFFASTHSPQIMGEVPRDEVLILKDDGAERPGIARGADSNWLLEHELGGAERNDGAKRLIDRVEAEIDAEDWGAARDALQELRDYLGEPDGEVARLGATIDGLEAMAREDD